MPKNFIYEKAKASRNLYHQLKTALDSMYSVLCYKAGTNTFKIDLKFTRKFTVM